jgi:hypothetical protein
MNPACSSSFEILRRGETEFVRRSVGRTFPEIDDGETCGRLQLASELSEVRNPIREVVVGVDNEHHVHRFRQVGTDQRRP